MPAEEIQKLKTVLNKEKIIFKLKASHEFFCFYKQHYSRQ